jgi:hypothetical protein
LGEGEGCPLVVAGHSHSKNGVASLAYAGDDDEEGTVPA